MIMLILGEINRSIGKGASITGSNNARAVNQTMVFFHTKDFYFSRKPVTFLERI